MHRQTEEPLLSTVVVIVSDTLNPACGTALLSRCLEALREQVDPPAMEIVVPHHPAVRGMPGLRKRFPGVRFVCAPDLKSFTGRPYSRDHHDELRTRGIQASRGALVGFLEDHEVPDRHWCRRVVEAHRGDAAVVGGAIENGIDRPLNWAVYFCDFALYQNPVPAGPAANASDANVAYKRAALEAVEPVWSDSYSEPAVHDAITKQVGRLVLSRDVVVYQRRPLRFTGAMAERFVWGRSYGAGRRRQRKGPHRLAYALAAPLLPPLILGRMAGRVLSRRRAVSAFFKAFPLTAVLVSGWCAGEVVGYWTARSHAHRS